MERRKNPRFDIGFPLSFSGHSATGSGRAVDLSMSGCKVECDTVPQNGDFLEVTLGPPDLDPPLKIDSAVVRWVKGQVFGVEFVYMSADATNSLDSLIQTVRKQAVKKEADRPAARPAPVRAKSKVVRKRPALVWGITLLYVVFAAVTFTAFAHLRAEAFPLPPAQEAFVSQLSSNDMNWALLAGAVGLLAAVRLFQLKAHATTLFLALLGISLCNGAWYAYHSDGLAYLLSMPGELIGRLIGLAVVLLTWAYALHLKRSRRLI